MSRSETDSVSPDGGNVSGEVTDRRFAYTLTITDIATEWTVERVQGSSLGQASVYASFPVSLKGDTGGEFSNTALKAGCEQREFPCTRTRSYHKNDNCYGEQKNGDGVRKAVGSARYQA
ncbi:MAG: transposase, partial [Treponema sp.]|nr:transposase [Treponema sp.]